MIKYQPSTKTKYYQKARFFRRTGDNQTAYCLEPFTMFQNSNYTSTITPRNLSQEQMDRIKRIIYFGYGYGNHWDGKWYAITQLMIWQTAQPDGDYYFTDKLNGNRVNYYDQEINEINSLISNSYIKPSIINKDYYFIKGKNGILKDTNNVLNNYKTTNNNIKISNNSLIINNIDEGDYKITLIKDNKKHNKPILFYQAENSQNLINVGDIESEQVSLNIHILKTKISITKIDKDTNSITVSGNASLDGAKYKLMDSNKNEIQILEIKNNVAEIENLQFGKYYLQEIEPGVGYTLDETIYEIIIDKDNTIKDLILKNKVIEKEITIEKQYGEGTIFKGEKNIEFEIYDSNGTLIKTIKTDDAGIAKITLPYGKYKIAQKNTTDGYTKISPFDIIVENQTNETITLKDYKIQVPNTHISLFTYLSKLLFQILILVC